MKPRSSRGKTERKGGRKIQDQGDGAVKERSRHTADVASDQARRGTAEMTRVVAAQGANRRGTKTKGIVCRRWRWRKGHAKEGACEGRGEQRGIHLPGRLLAMGLPIDDGNGDGGTGGCSQRMKDARRETQDGKGWLSWK